MWALKIWPFFKRLSSHNFLFQYGLATKFSKFVDNLFGFNKHKVLILLALFKEKNSDNSCYMSEVMNC